MRWWIAVLAACCAVTAHAQTQEQEKPAAQESAEPSATETAPPRARRHRHAHGHHHHHGHRHAGHAHSHGKPKARPRKRTQAEPHTHAHRAAGPHAHGEAGHHHHGIETEHLFGFTAGTDIDAPGARHAIADLDGPLYARERRLRSVVAALRIRLHAVARLSRRVERIARGAFDCGRAGTRRPAQRHVRGRPASSCASGCSTAARRRSGSR